MYLKLVFLTSLIFVTTSHQSGSFRIAGGTYATQGEFPYMVAIFYYGHFVCGGSIISEEWIMTAAHCVYNLASSEISVLSGTIKLETKSGKETPVSQVIYHEYFHNNSINLPNDIALLRLSTALVFDGNTKAVSLPLYKENVPDYEEVHVMGWGNEQYNGTGTGTPSHILQKATVYVIPNNICAVPYTYYHLNLLSTNVCGGTQNGGKGHCKGDSGGPMVYSKKSTQIGISSLSVFPCGHKDYPGIFTRVSEYRNWIKVKSGV